MNESIRKSLALWAILGAVAVPARGAIETNHLDTLFPEIYDTPEIYLRKIAAAANKIATNPVSISSGTLNATIDQSSISNLLYQLRVNSTNGTASLSRDRITYSQAWVLTNASIQDYIYMRGTNGFFSKPGGSGMIQSISISGATNHTGTIHLFGCSPLETTNGMPWNNDLFGQGATNRMGPARSLAYMSKAGTNYIVGCDANIPVQNRDGTTNLYWIITGGVTSVTNYPGQYGTNYGVTFSGVSDDLIQ